MRKSASSSASTTPKLGLMTAETTTTAHSKINNNDHASAATTNISSSERSVDSFVMSDNFGPDDHQDNQVEVVISSPRNRKVHNFVSGTQRFETVEFDLNEEPFGTPPNSTTTIDNPPPPAHPDDSPGKNPKFKALMARFQNSIGATSPANGDGDPFKWFNSAASGDGLKRTWARRN